MDYEKKYKEALERAREIHNEHQAQCFDVMMKVFPELAESEDEKIRKGLIQHLQELRKPHVNLMTKDTYDSWISWLEKQGKQEEKPTKEQVWDYCNKISSEWWQITMDKWNTLADEDKNKYNQFIGFNDFSDTLMNITAGALFQLIDTGKLEYEEGSLLLEKPDDTPKPLEVTNAINEKQGERRPTDKVESKFKVGDWIYHEISGNTFHINKIKNGLYVSDEGATISLGRQNDWRLWTIQDARDGDVLAEDSCMFIIEKLKSKETAIVYCCLFDDGDFDLIGSNLCFDVDSTYPATKEQCEFLFQKMKDVGYEWDVVKKELKKV